MKKHFVSVIVAVVLALSCSMLSRAAETREQKVVFYHDGIPSYACTYASKGLYKMELKDKKEGIASVRFLWYEPEGKWCGGEISGVHPKDLTSFRKEGLLKFWIKSESEEEGLVVGFTDKDGFIVLKPLKLYLGKTTPRWQQVAIPLADFAKVGSRWDDKAGRRVSRLFGWDGVLGFAIDAGAGDGEKHVVYFDNIEVVNP